MFERHFYTFGGKQFKQSGGGPIGLRGTCAIARLVMQWWDKQWLARVDGLGLKINLAVRYMDDG